MAKIVSKILSKNIKINHIGLDIREDSIFLVYQGLGYFLSSHGELQILLDSLKTQNEKNNVIKTVSICLPEKHLLIKELILPGHLKIKDVDKAVKLHFQQLFPWPIQECFWNYLVFRKDSLNVSLEDSFIAKVYVLKRLNYEGVFTVLNDNGIKVQEVQLSTHLIAEKFESEVVIQLYNKYIICTLLENNFPRNYIVFEHDGVKEKETHSELIEKIQFYLKYVTGCNNSFPEFEVNESVFEKRLLMNLTWDNEFNQILFENLIKTKKEWIPEKFILIEDKNPFSVGKILYERRNLK